MRCDTLSCAAMSRLGASSPPPDSSIDAGVGRRNVQVGFPAALEFVLVCRDVLPQAGRALVEKLRASVSDSPIPLRGRMLRVGLSVGCALDGDASTPETLVAAADRDMYADKVRRRGAHRPPSPPPGDVLPRTGSAPG